MTSTSEALPSDLRDRDTIARELDETYQVYLRQLIRDLLPRIDWLV